MVMLWGGNDEIQRYCADRSQEANGRARSCGICACTLRYVGIADSSTPLIDPYVIHDGPEFDERPPGHLGVSVFFTTNIT